MLIITFTIFILLVAFGYGWIVLDLLLHSDSLAIKLLVLFFWITAMALSLTLATTLS